LANGVKVVLDKSGIRDLLRSDEILSNLMDVAEGVARDAGSSYEAREWMRPTRAVANVVDTRENAMFLESSSGSLARAIGRSGG
jgi:hypothetical protein